MNVSAVGLSRYQIRKITNIVRESLGLEDQLFFPIVEVIELMASDDNNDFNYEILSEHEMTDTYGTTNTWTNTMKIREDVYEGAVNGRARDRFTLCHELGHYFLHRPEMISNARGKVPTFRNPEWQANTFAGEIMAPCNLIYNMTIEEISEECGISYTAAAIQFEKAHS